MKTTFIYILNCPITGEVKYIGKSDNPEKRLRRHLERCRTKSKSRKNNWILSLMKKGMKPTLEILDEVVVDEWKFWEKHYISLFKSWGFDLKNETTGGDSTELSAEARHKISIANKGRPSPLRGTKITGEHLENLRWANKINEKVSPEKTIQIMEIKLATKI